MITSIFEMEMFSRMIYGSYGHIGFKNINGKMILYRKNKRQQWRKLSDKQISEINPVYLSELKKLRKIRFY